MIIYLQSYIPTKMGQSPTKNGTYSLQKQGVLPTKTGRTPYNSLNDEGVWGPRPTFGSNSLPMMPDAPHPTLVVQHNALINARVRLSALEMRLFVALLGRIRYLAHELGTHLVSVQELCPSSASHNNHAKVQDMCHELQTRRLEVEALGPDGEHLPLSPRMVLPLLGVCDYLPHEGQVRAAFHPLLAPYLLGLTRQFTKAPLAMLATLTSPAAHRLYWLLSEPAAMGRTTRTVALAELRAMLGQPGAYAGRFDRFRARVLDMARQELADTDRAFAYGTRTAGRAVTHLVFYFGAGARPAAPEPTWRAESWQALVRGSGVAARSVVQIQKGLDAGTYDEGYIRFVVATTRQRVAAGRVTKEGGAVYKAITDKQLWETYRKSLLRPARRPEPGKASRDAPESELEAPHPVR